MKVIVVITSFVSENSIRTKCFRKLLNEGRKVPSKILSGISLGAFVKILIVLFSMWKQTVEQNHIPKSWFSSVKTNKKSGSFKWDICLLDRKIITGTNSTSRKT